MLERTDLSENKAEIKLVCVFSCLFVLFVVVLNTISSVEFSLLNSKPIAYNGYEVHQIKKVVNSILNSIQIDCEHCDSIGTEVFALSHPCGLESGPQSSD